jgi:hypothetical protein
MAELFASGAIIDLIIILVLLETMTLIGLRRMTGRGPRPAILLPTLASGLLLMLALRAAIADAPWPLIALPLSLALITHLLDLSQRWHDH